MTGVNRDLGSYDDPDAFYAQHHANLSGFREWLYRHVVRHRMNRNVASIRTCRGAVSCGPRAGVGHRDA
jgi:hypothetical protein